MADQITDYHGIVKPEKGKTDWENDYYGFVDVVDKNLKKSGTLANRPSVSSVDDYTIYHAWDVGQIYWADSSSGEWVNANTGVSSNPLPESYYLELYAENKQSIPIYSDDTNAPNSTIYFNSASSILKYKDSSGNIHESGSNTGGGNSLSYITGHSNWENGLSNEEIHRFDLSSGEQFQLEEIQFQQRGGGSSNASASVDILDVTNSTVLDSTDLNTKSTSGGTSGDSSTIILRITNSTGGNIDASITVRGVLV